MLLGEGAFGREAQTAEDREEREKEQAANHNSRP